MGVCDKEAEITYVSHHPEKTANCMKIKETAKCTSYYMVCLASIKVLFVKRTDGHNCSRLTLENNVFYI